MYRVAIYGEGVFDAETLDGAVKLANASSSDTVEIYYHEWKHYLKGIRNKDGNFTWHISNCQNEELMAC